MVVYFNFIRNQICSEQENRGRDLARMKCYDYIPTGESCCRLTAKKQPCRVRKGRHLENGSWICHLHDPDGKFQTSLNLEEEDAEPRPDVPDQMFFSDIVGSEADPPRSQPKRLHLLDDGAELFAPPSKEAARIAGKRARSFGKWEDSL